MMDTRNRMRWSTEQRLEFIEFRLFWEGQVNRGDLVTRFGISTPQASMDLARYDAAAPGNLLYDSSRRTYVAGPRFAPRFYEPSARQYLAELRALADESSTRSGSWLGLIPEFGVVPLVRRKLDAAVLRQVLLSIRGKEAMKVKYQSLSSTEPEWRWITPHALGFDGSRWHARAWCHKNGAFRDFVLARYLEIGERTPHTFDTQLDLEWQREVTLRIGSHPKLGEGRRRVIELDYGMDDGVLEVRTRLSLRYYLERNLCLDDDASKNLSPTRVQIALLNRDELDAEASAVAVAQKQLQKEHRTINRIAA